MRPLFAACIFALAAGRADAAACGPDRAADIPELEALKSAFLAADYRQFAELAGPYFPDLVDNLNGYFGQVMVVFPNPFPACETVLQRREEPGFYQDVVFYYPAGAAAPIALLLVAVRAEGQTRLVEFTFNTAISEVLEDIK